MRVLGENKPMQARRQGLPETIWILQRKLVLRHLAIDGQSVVIRCVTADDSPKSRIGVAGCERTISNSSIWPRRNPVVRLPQAFCELRRQPQVVIFDAQRSNDGQPREAHAYKVAAKAMHMVAVQTLPATIGRVYTDLARMNMLPPRDFVFVLEDLQNFLGCLYTLLAIPLINAHQNRDDRWIGLQCARR